MQFFQLSTRTEKQFWTTMPVHATPALCLCSRDMFGEQEQLFSSLTSSQETFAF